MSQNQIGKDLNVKNFIFLGSILMAFLGLYFVLIGFPIMCFPTLAVCALGVCILTNGDY
jgi:hypothetical protein